LDDGKTIRATLDQNELKRVLKRDAVSEVREIPEYQLSANFVLLQDPPVVQVGESEHTFAATPYWDAGVDGGGCVAPSTQCSSTIPATIVAILDNGASTDAATLAHIASPLTEA